MKCRGCGVELPVYDPHGDGDALCGSNGCYFACAAWALDAEKERGLVMPKATVDAWLEAGAPGRREVRT